MLAKEQCYGASIASTRPTTTHGIFTCKTIVFLLYYMEKKDLVRPNVFIKRQGSKVSMSITTDSC